MRRAVWALFSVILAGQVAPAAAWQESRDGVTVYTEDLIDEDGWKYGYNVFVHNGNASAMDIHPWMYQHEGVQWSLAQQKVGPGQKATLGWVVANEEGRRNGYKHLIKWNQTPIQDFGPLNRTTPAPAPFTPPPASRTSDIDVGQKGMEIMNDALKALQRYQD